MASRKKSRSSLLDPNKDGPRVFDTHPSRLQMAMACQRPVPAARLAVASGQEDANARKTAETLVRYGVLEDVALAKSKTGYRLNESWRAAVNEALIKASKGSLAEGQMMFLVERDSTRAFYRLMADRDRVDRRLIWVSRFPQHPKFGLLVAVDPRLSEDEIERLSTELEEAGVSHERLLIGRMANAQELRELAASSLPGALGEEG